MVSVVYLHLPQLSPHSNSSGLKLTWKFPKLTDYFLIRFWSSNGSNHKLLIMATQRVKNKIADFPRISQSDQLSFGKSVFSYITKLCSDFMRTCFGENMSKRPCELLSKKACWQPDRVFNSWINWMDRSWPTPRVLNWLAGEKPMIHVYSDSTKPAQLLLNFPDRGGKGSQHGHPHLIFNTQLFCFLVKVVEVGVTSGGRKIW